MAITWCGRNGKGYECSSIGDKRFSALYAKMPDGRTIEQWYQCDIKGYDIGGTNWRLGKGKPPQFNYPEGHLWQLYLSLWRLWTIRNGALIVELNKLVQDQGSIIKDSYATTPINQAHALCVILNEWLA